MNYYKYHCSQVVQGAEELLSRSDKNRCPVSKFEWTEIRNSIILGTDKVPTAKVTPNRGRLTPNGEPQFCF